MVKFLVDLVRGDSIQEKCDLFEIDPELKISILSGLVKLKNSSYIINNKRSARTSQISLIYSLRTYSQEILIKRHLNSIDKDLLKTVVATHLVVAIEWGCNCYISCEHDIDDNDSKNYIQDQMGA